MRVTAQSRAMPNVLNAGNGVKQLIWTRVISHTQEPPERKNRVSDAALFHVDHQMFDCSEILFLTVDDLIACKSVCRHNTLHPLDRKSVV